MLGLMQSQPFRIAPAGERSEAPGSNSEGCPTPRCLAYRPARFLGGAGSRRSPLTRKCTNQSRIRSRFSTRRYGVPERVSSCDSPGVRMSRTGRRIERLTRGSGLGHVASVSDGAAAKGVAEALAAVPPGRSVSWEIATPVQLLECPPNRLLTGPGALESLALENGSTGHLPARVPPVAIPPASLYWMSDVMPVGWQPVADSRLGPSIVRWPGYDTASTRTTRDGATFLCPHFIRQGEPDLRGDRLGAREGG